MFPPIDHKKLAAAIDALKPKSPLQKRLNKIPFIGTIITNARELLHFRKAFLVKRFAAEQGASNWDLF